MKKEEIRMKHYRICIQAERHEFEHLSSTISEAYGAIEGTLLRRIGIPSGYA